MKITLITVCWNSAATIRTTLASVAAQTGVAIDYWVVDGGSTDGTVEIVRSFADTVAGRPDFEFHWISERDRGLYDAMNKGIARAAGDLIGILNADDALASDETLAQIAAGFADGLDGVYADIRFVRDASTPPLTDLAALRALPTTRYCTGKWFRPWMFRFGTQTAHPSTFFTKDAFAKWGNYSLDFGLYADFELLCRFIWKNRAKMRYLPLCTTVMRLGGASTNGWRTTLKINRMDLRALKANGCWSCLPLLYSRYLFKIWGFVFRRLSK